MLIGKFFSTASAKEVATRYKFYEMLNVEGLLYASRTSVISKVLLCVEEVMW